MIFEYVKSSIIAFISYWANFRLILEITRSVKNSLMLGHRGLLKSGSTWSCINITIYLLFLYFKRWITQSIGVVNITFHLIFLYFKCWINHSIGVINIINFLFLIYVVMTFFRTFQNGRICFIRKVLLYGLYCLCFSYVFKGVVRLRLLEKSLSHWMLWYGFSPVCVFRWE